MFDKNTAIEVDKLSKIYRIGIKDELHDSFAKTAFSYITNPIRNFRKYRSLYVFKDAEGPSGEVPTDIIWAVKNISFNVKKGEVLGIIGRNGAGKSTLLKILCRITDPTKGRARVRGRVSSLLEVGTGFHHELTGRENVYLNGTILGMTKAEVKQKFDQIVEFSGVEKFIDTPVKRYSSGMRVRLAFSVAAFLDPEVLIIDEVLAVGDEDFQKKCLNKMNDIGQRGRTVIFVSHNMGAVSRLCDRVIILKDGQIVEDGLSDQTIRKYLGANHGTCAIKKWDNSSLSTGNKPVRLRSVRVTDKNGEVNEFFDIRKPVFIEMEYIVIQSGLELLPHLSLKNELNVVVFKAIDNDPNWRERPRPVGTYTSKVEIPGNFLASGRFFVAVGMLTIKPENSQFNEKDAVSFQIVDRSGWDTARGVYTGDLQSIVRPRLRWETKIAAELEPSGQSISEEQPSYTLSDLAFEQAD